MTSSEDDLPEGLLPAVFRPGWMDRITGNSVTEKDIKKAKDMIEGDPNIAKNGWTPEALAKYFKQQEESHSNKILHRRSPRPIRQNGKYNAHRWRR